MRQKIWSTIASIRKMAGAIDAGQVKMVALLMQVAEMTMALQVVVRAVEHRL